MRGLLDHVPPIFGKATFGEVVNNYAGKGKAFKEAMHHLENAARKVADAHLHMPIRKCETLPTPQQIIKICSANRFRSGSGLPLQNPMWQCHTGKLRRTPD